MNYSVDQYLLDEINAFNMFTAQIRVLRPATLSLDGDILDTSDFVYEHRELSSGEEREHEALPNVAICIVEVYKNGELYCSLPNRLTVYPNDWEYLETSRNEAIDNFRDAYLKGYLK